MLTLTPSASADIVKAAKRRSGSHNARRGLVERLLWEHLAAQLQQRADGRAVGVIEPGPAANEISAAELGAELRRRPEVIELLERIWPRLTAETFLHDLFGAKPLIELAGSGALNQAELDLLYRPRSTTVDEIPWSQADIALLDEAAWLLGPLRSRTGPEQRSYGHIVVDEVQDLSPMELRMVGRRSLSGSMTLVGDIAQATGYWAPATWDDLMAHLPARRGWRLTSLSVSYRASAEVMELAANVLAAALPGAAPPEPVRRTGQRPRVLALNGVRRWHRDGDGDGGTAAWHALVSRTVDEELRCRFRHRGGRGRERGCARPLSAVGRHQVGSGGSRYRLRRGRFGSSGHTGQPAGPCRRQGPRIRLGRRRRAGPDRGATARGFACPLRGRDAVHAAAGDRAPGATA